MVVEAQPTVNLSVATDNQVYYGFTPVTIYGSLQNNNIPKNDGLIGLQVDDSNGNTIVIRTLNTGASNPSNLPIQISSAYMSDLSGANQQSNIQVETLGYFSIKLLNNYNAIQNMLVTVNIYDSDGVPIGEISGGCSLIAGQSGTATLSIQIPSWAHKGIAYGYANVYTDSPAKGGVPITNEQSFKFTITNGLAVLTGSAPSNTANQGSYTCTFRLPTKGMPDSIYKVAASSSYSGTTVTKNTTFNANFADYNGDGVVDYNDVLIFISSYIKYNQDNSIYNPSCDMDKNGIIAYNDAVQLISCYIAYGRF
jgi:hypothetical protein